MNDNSDLIGKIIVLGGTQLNGKEPETLFGRITEIDENGLLTAVCINDDPRLRHIKRTDLNPDDVRRKLRVHARGTN